MHSALLMIFFYFYLYLFVSKSFPLAGNEYSVPGDAGDG